MFQRFILQEDCQSVSRVLHPLHTVRFQLHAWHLWILLVSQRFKHWRFPAGFRPGGTLTVAWRAFSFLSISKPNSGWQQTMQCHRSFFSGNLHFPKQHAVNCHYGLFLMVAPSHWWNVALSVMYRCWQTSPPFNYSWRGDQAVTCLNQKVLLVTECKSYLVLNSTSIKAPCNFCS